MAVDKKDFKKMRAGMQSGVMAGRDSDPLFYRALSTLPNPDPILRKLGRADDVFDAIASDAHVQGELRAIRAGLLKHNIIVNPGGEGAKEKAAADLCREWFSFSPAPMMTWPDIIWNMATAVFRGRRFHELVWEPWDGYLMPVEIIDIPNRRFVFNNANKLRLLTKESPIEGVEVPDYKFLVSRHMPSSENPYGMALFSSCFWPYTFKHGGWKFFYKFCEKHGLPWPVGKYPQGTPEPEQKAFADALEAMMESGYAVIPDGDVVELLTISVTGDLAQERLIALCNKEMSMALTSQSLITNQQSVGSFAATQTSRDREKSVNDSDKSIIEATFNMAFEHITRINFGDDVMPPKLMLKRDDEINTQLLDSYVKAAGVSDRVDLVEFHQRTGIKMADAGAPTLRSSANAQQQALSNFAAGGDAITVSNTDLDAALEAANNAIATDWIKPAFDMLQEYEASGKTLKQYLDDLPKLYGKMDDNQVQSITSAVLKLSMAKGMKAADA